MNDVTIVYYSANKEKPELEKLVTDNILKVSNGLPIISVTQKPMDFGRNICVGELPWCDKSAFTQLLTALREVKTTFAIATESDVLYPPEYFTFVPPTEDNAYRYDNVWILHAWHGPRNKGLFWKKDFSEGAQMCGVKHWISRLESVMDKFVDVGGGRIPTPRVFRSGKTYSWSGVAPVISLKTEQGLRKWTGVRSEDEAVTTLPYWGDATELRKKLFDSN